MFNKLSANLNCVTSSLYYWLFLLVSGVLTLAIALYYQYGLNEWPCVLCIHIRLWVSLLIIVSVIGLLSRNSKTMGYVSNSLLLVVAAGLSERSYMLLGTEKGFVFGDCGFDVGLPAWLAIEEWLPWLYRVESSCGYTPELWLGVTMAEALMLMSVGLLLLSLSALIAYVAKKG